MNIGVHGRNVSDESAYFSAFSCNVTFTGKKVPVTRDLLGILPHGDFFLLNCNISDYVIQHFKSIDEAVWEIQY